MARFETITEADLLDYVEGRLSANDRAKVAARLATDPALAAKCAGVCERTLHVRLLRWILPVEAVPREWLDLLNEGRPR